MSLIQMDFFSESLNMFTQVNIILPLPRDCRREVQDMPVLYLFHGMGDGASSWLRKTSIERHALERGLAVVMPDGGLSCYENMLHGAKYRSYFTEELPRFIQTNFPVSTKREKNFIAGCSMGGFGALKLGMANPEMFGAIGCLSAAHFEYQPDSPRHRAMISRVYADQLEAFDARIAADAQAANSSGLPLHIWHCCGDQDALKENALKSRAFFESLPIGSIQYHFEILPGSHDWALWDAAIQRFIAQLNLPQPEVYLY